MSADPSNIDLLTKIGEGLVGGISAVVAPVVWINKQLAKKAEKEDLTKCFRHIEKLYENAEADRRLTRDLHDKSMEQITDGQRQIIDLISRRP